MKPAITLARIAVALSACLTLAAPAIARDRGQGGGFDMVVRDHRAPVIVRDHRAPVIVRDHRAPVIVRDHRAPKGSQGGVVVTSSARSHGGSPCVRSVFGGPCIGF